MVDTEMAENKTMSRTVWLAGVLTLTMGMNGCFTAEDPGIFACSDTERGCPDGYTCDPGSWTCIKRGTKTDSRIDGPGPDLSTHVPGTWIKVQNGNFPMGSPATEPCREPLAHLGIKETQHNVTLSSDFEIMDTEVTQEDFKTVLGLSPSNMAGCKTCPVESVTWHEAAAYCNALSLSKSVETCYTCSKETSDSGIVNYICGEAKAFEGSKIYNCQGYRLPTEAEWEHAYRAGTTTAYYSGKNDPQACIDKEDTAASVIGWYNSNASKKTHPVKTKAANKLKLYDMAGNVWEWCHDWLQKDLTKAEAWDPVGTKSDGMKVTRGGTFADFAQHLRAAARDGQDRSTRKPFIGFRCARRFSN